MAGSTPPTPLPWTPLLTRHTEWIAENVDVGGPIAVIIGVVWSRKE